jgi:hypothetical protein
MIEQAPAPEAVPQSADDREEKIPEAAISTVEDTIEINKPIEKLQEPSIEGDDDTSQSDQRISSNNGQKAEAGSPAELVQIGMSFFGRLTETLSNPVATEKLISTLVQKDETDGKTYLKIPVENQKVVENAFALFAGLIGSLKK